MSLWENGSDTIPNLEQGYLVSDSFHNTAAVCGQTRMFRSTYQKSGQLLWVHHEELDNRL
jgi:hypothetical protein